MIFLPVRGGPLDDLEFTDDLFDEVDDEIPPGFFDEVDHEVDDDPIEDFEEYDILDDDDESFMFHHVPASQGDPVDVDNNPQHGQNAHDNDPPPPLAEDSGAEDGPPAKRFRIRGKTSVGLSADDVQMLVIANNTFVEDYAELKPADKDWIDENTMPVRIERGDLFEPDSP